MKLKVIAQALFLFLLSQTVVFAQTHIDLKDAKMEEEFELGDDGFMLLTLTSKNWHVAVYSPEVQLKWEKDIPFQAFPKDIFDRQVLYNEKSIFLCGHYPFKDFSIISFDHNGKQIAAISNPQPKENVRAFMPAPDGIATYSADTRTETHYTYRVYNNSLKEPKAYDIAFPAGYWSLAGTDGDKTFFSGESHKFSEDHGITVEIVSINSAGQFNEEFTADIKPSNMCPIPESELASYVDVRYDGYSNSFFAYGYSMDDKRARPGASAGMAPSHMGYYVQQYDAKGKLLAQTGGTFKELRAKVPDLSVNPTSNLVIALDADAEGNVYLAGGYITNGGKHFGLLFNKDLSLNKGLSYTVNDSRPDNLPGTDLTGSSMTSEFRNRADIQTNALDKKIAEISAQAGKVPYSFGIAYQDDKKAVLIVKNSKEKSMDIYVVPMK